MARQRRTSLTAARPSHRSSYAGDPPSDILSRPSLLLLPRRRSHRLRERTADLLAKRVQGQPGRLGRPIELPQFSFQDSDLLVLILQRGLERTQAEVCGVPSRFRRFARHLALRFRRRPSRQSPCVSLRQAWRPRSRAGPPYRRLLKLSVACAHLLHLAVSCGSLCLLKLLARRGAAETGSQEAAAKPRHLLRRAGFR